MENNSSEDRRREADRSNLPAPYTFLTRVHVRLVQAAGQGFAFPSRSERTALPLPRCSRGARAAPRPQPALPTALQLQHNHVTAAHQPGAQLLKGAASTVQVNSTT